MSGGKNKMTIHGASLSISPKGNTVNKANNIIELFWK